MRKITIINRLFSTCKVTATDGTINSANGETNNANNIANKSV